MPELEILEAKVPVRTPVLIREAETASSRLGPVAGWLSGPVFSRARDIFAANMTELLDRAEDPARMIRMIIMEMEETLVDVRSPGEYSGELLAPANLPQEGAQRGGHIPGAKNVPWAQAVKEDGTFKSAEDLRNLYASKGVTGDKEVVAYCRIGERSAHTWFVLTQLLGYNNVLNYDGSWTEWGSLIGAPIER